MGSEDDSGLSRCHHPVALPVSGDPVGAQRAASIATAAQRDQTHHHHQQPAGAGDQRRSHMQGDELVQGRKHRRTVEKNKYKPCLFGLV